MLLLEIFSEQHALYVKRPLLMSDAFSRWVSDNFRDPLAADDFHVTVAYSTKAFTNPLSPQTGKLIIHGGHRAIAKFDGGAIVLQLTSPELAARWQQFRDAGASWDYESYHPHITLSYESKNGGGAIEPFAGELTFGGEVFKRIHSDDDLTS